MSKTVTPQPRLLVNTIDAKAATNPDSPWLLYAKSPSSEPEGGYQTITWKQFAHAVNKTAFWLDSNLPRTEQSSQTFAYLGPNDARYYILLAAAAKSKRRVSRPSLSSVEMHLLL
jgi:acyl-CoA synthetase (AMP-forming)/AMP-acid ligase II